MISVSCHAEQKGPVYQEDGFFIGTCTPYPYREEKTEILTSDNVKDNPNKFNTETNVIAEPMGSGYPEIIQGASQVEDHLKTSVHARIHDEANL